MDNLIHKNSRTVYITGHKNPDTDSICSAIAYAKLKRRLGVDAMPVRTGRINRETQFVLDSFGFAPPDYLATVKTQISDLAMDTIEPVLPGTSIKEAWRRLRESNLEVLPVEYENHSFAGIVSVSDIAGAYMDMPDSNALSACGTPIENVLKTLEADLILGFQTSLDGAGNVIIAAMTPDGMDEYIKTDDIVFAGNIRVNQKKAIEAGANCVIVTCGSTISEEIIEIARQHECTLISTKFDTFKATRLIYQSIPVRHAMTSAHLMLFHIDDFVDDVREKMLQTRYRSYPVVDVDNQFAGFISRYHLLSQHKKQVILVDHSEIAQSVNGVEQAEILEIIDHHRIGSIQTGNPIYYRNEPTGSTATIVANLYSEQGVKPEPEIAGILCAAILSDTIRFKSPTSTHADRITAERLAKLAGLDIDAFSAKMFSAGSSLKNMTADEIIKSDFKDFEIGKYKVGIGQVNTTDLRSLKKMRGELLESLNVMAERERYNILIVLFTDILDEATEALFVESQKGLVARAFSPLADENSFTMGGVVSRKKQIVPKLVATLAG
jgi:manganese-dependent inorganic pyrophosphatase